MKTDYQIVTINRKSDSTDVIIRKYEGDVTTKSEFNEKTQAKEDVTRYRRTRLLGEKEISYAAGISDADIISNLNTDLGTDTTRDPIKEQVNG